MELIKPSNPTDVYFILHESARYLHELAYEYMVGSLREDLLREDLQKHKFGLPLTDEGYKRARDVGRKLCGAQIEEIVTDKFITPLETTEVIAEESGLQPKIYLADPEKSKILTDSRITESDLAYLTRERFEELMRKSKDDPFIFTRDWYKQASKEEKDQLYNGHVEVWNEAIKRNDGKPFAFVLHVEGMQFYVNELLARPREEMINLHFKRGNYVHVKLVPNRKPIISF